MKVFKNNIIKMIILYYTLPWNIILYYIILYYIILYYIILYYIILYYIIVGKSVVKRPLGSPRRRWEDNIKMDLQEVGCEVWTGSSWLRIGRGGEHL